MRRALSLLCLLGLLGCQSPAAAPRPIASPRPTATIAPTMTPLPPLTIVTLGDSLTWGDKDDEPGGGWPHRLLQLLRSTRPQTQLVNLALPGWTSHDLLHGTGGAPNQIDQAVKILSGASGDKIATVWIGVNDLFYLYEFGDPTEVEEDREADRFERDLAALLDRLQSTGARLFIAQLHDPSIGPVQTSGVFRSITAGEWDKLSRQARRYQAIIAAQAAPRAATLVDVTAIFNSPAVMFEDGIHPNARGYDELAKVWWKALRDTPTR
jgi:lysophospholipase L1-like esterase